MSNLGKCHKCGKTCYQLEGFKVGPPGQELVYHKLCFKCQNEGCNWQLNLTNYKFYEGRAYCKNHCPITGFSNKVQGQDVRVHGTTTTDAVHIEKALNAPKLDTVNEQLRGSKAGQNKNAQNVFY
ncbi:LIM zinc-binding domain-containing protein [Balamuthia mandrillaris]